MREKLANKNLITKAFIILLCAVFCLSCQTDQNALQNDTKAEDKSALQVDAKSKTEINRINQIVSSGRKISQEDFDLVKKIYEQYPSSEPVRKTFQNALIQREDWVLLDKFFNEIPATERNEEDNLTLAKVYIKLGRFEDSAEVLKTIKDQNNLETKSLLANANFYLGKYDEAKNLLDSSWEQIIKEKRIDDIYVRGMLYFYNKEDEKAIETFEKVLEIDPNHIPSNNALSRVYAKKGDAAKAEEYVKKTAKAQKEIQNETYAKSQQVGKIHELEAAWNNKKYQEVIKLSKEMLPGAKDKNQKTILYQYLYESYQALGMQTEAQDVLKQAQQLNQK